MHLPTLMSLIWLLKYQCVGRGPGVMHSRGLLTERGVDRRDLQRVACSIACSIDGSTSDRKVTNHCCGMVAAFLQCGRKGSFGSLNYYKRIGIFINRRSMNWASGPLRSPPHFAGFYWAAIEVFPLTPSDCCCSLLRFKEKQFTR